MQETEFRQLKIDDQIEHLVGEVCLKLEEIGFLGVSVSINMGGFDYHIVVDTLYLHHKKNSAYLKRIENAKKTCLHFINKGSGKSYVRNSSHAWTMSSFIQKAGGLKGLTWEGLYQRISSIKTDKYRDRKDSYLIVNGAKVPAQSRTRNAVIGLLSKFLMQLDGERFDYLSGVVDYYSAFLALSEGNLIGLPNCKLSKRHIEQGEKDE